MRAYVLEADDTAALREVESPSAGRGEVQIRVRASSLHPHDLHVLSGAARAYLEYDFLAILGSDVAGEVEAVGPGVSRVKVGDRVLGLQRSSRVHNGTFAKHVVLPETSVARMPDNIDDAHAGMLGLAAIAALTAIDAAQLGACSTVLINGATGGVGSYAIQLAALRGARVLATARAGAATDLVRDLGASTTIDWTTEDVANAAADGGGADVRLDFVNIDIDALLQVLRTVDGRIATDLVSPRIRRSADAGGPCPERAPNAGQTLAAGGNSWPLLATPARPENGR